MSKRFGFVTFLLFFICTVNVCFGQWVFWTNNEGAGDGQWATTTNWAVGYPTASDDVVILKDAGNAAVIRAGVTGYANWMHLCDTSATGSKVLVSGGTLAVSDHLLIGEWGVDQKGTLQVDSGTVNTVLLMCGGDRGGNNGNGTLIVNGGNVNIGWLLAVGGGYDGVSTGGVGNVQLAGGVVTMATGGNVIGEGGLIMSNGGLLNIAGGALSLNGVITDITALANGGTITAYGGTGSFVYDYSIAGRTTVTAVIPEPATLVVIALGSLLIRRKK
ncbi:MAG: hypothetical protein A2Y12_20200 [Planctomycetes bacterium GWF2_42_9]|nr:MAG: hypothetical protein A2Y12_20200 [Planctomycetes bacterium GWF2_42_9]